MVSCTVDGAVHGAMPPFGKLKVDGDLFVFEAASRVQAASAAGLDSGEHASTIQSLGTVELGVAVGTPDSIGNLDMDVRELLTYGIDKLNRNTYLAANELDTSNWLSFTGTFSDSFYADRVRSTTTDEPVIDGSKDLATFYAIDGVRYLLDLYGQNFAEYLVPQTVAYPARWLTAFPEPTRFPGYPWSVSAIINQDLGREDINLVVDMAAIATLDNTLGTGVYFINPSDTPLTLTSIMYLQNFGTSGNFALVAGYVSPGYTIDVNPVPVSPFQVTETLTVRNNLDCHPYPVYLCWRNSLGGWDYWLFDKKHEVAYTASQGTAFDVYVPELQNSGVRSRITQANQLKALTLGDLVDEITLTGLAEIERSPQVYMLWDADQFNGIYPERAWLGVRIAPKGFKYFTNAGNIEVEVTILLPELYTVRN